MGIVATKHKIIRPFVTYNDKTNIINLPNDIVYLADTDNPSEYIMFAENREFLGIVYEYQRTGEYISPEIN